MKKIFLLFIFIFTSLSFAQLQKPSKGSAISDSLSLKYLKADSNNVFSNYPLSRISSGYVTTYNNVISLGNYSCYPYGNGQMSNIIAIGDHTFYQGYNPNNNPSTYSQDIAIGNYAGALDNGYSPYGNGISYNNYIGFSCARNSSISTSQNIYNNFLGTYTGYLSSAMKYCNLIGYYVGQGATMTYSNIIGYGDNTYPVLGDYSNIIGYANGLNGTHEYCIYLGNNIATNLSIATHFNHDIFIGNKPYINNTTVNGQIYISDNTYFPASNFIWGDMTTANFYIRGNINVDSAGMTIRYNSLSGLPNRTAGIDSLLNGTDTVYTTAYDANSLVFITDLSPAGTPGHQYVSKAISVSGSYFVVKSMSALDDSQFNWFILKTY